uniref:Ig-like domain-containing protein n=1 Tax=Anolis carolinensis TaxID=28377 RepID=H9GTB3_ANOCA
MEQGWEENGFINKHLGISKDVPIIKLCFILENAALAELRRCFSSSSSHSLRYFYTAASEDNKWLSSFIIVGYVDDQRICQYDSIVREKRPCVPWMSKVEEEDPSYWAEETEVSRNSELFFKVSLVTANNRYNQSGGFHTLQQMYGCDLRKDGSKAGYRQYAYDGKDFISFDKETLTWTAADVKAQITKRTWDAQSTRNQYLKAYLEEECIKWLQKYLEYGNETLLRTEKPEVKVTRKVDYDGMETLICRVGGFYPKDIDIEWTRDGEVWMQDTFHGLVSPNSDGTYYTWRSITVDPKERERYKCHVEHDGLPSPVDVAWEDPASKSVLIGCAVGILLPITGLAVYFREHSVVVGDHFPFEDSLSLKGRFSFAYILKAWTSPFASSYPTS